MTYTKTTWTAGVALTVANLDNLASQYDLAYTDFENHNHNTLYYTKTEMDANFWNEDNDGTGSGCDADMLYCSTGNKHATDLMGVGGVTGMIIMWESLTIPSGWQECDGTNGTKDLRDKFVIGAGSGSGLSIGQIYGGDVSPEGTITVEGHILTVSEISGHGHTFQDMGPAYGTSHCDWESPYWYAAYDTGSTSRTTDQCSTGATSPTAHGHPGTLFTGDEFTPLPPCKVLIYIQKL